VCVCTHTYRERDGVGGKPKTSQKKNDHKGKKVLFSIPSNLEEDPKTGGRVCCLLDFLLLTDFKIWRESNNVVLSLNQVMFNKIDPILKCGVPMRGNIDA